MTSRMLAWSRAYRKLTSSFIVIILGAVFGCGGGAGGSQLPTRLKPNVVVLQDSVSVSNVTDTGLTLSGSVPSGLGPGSVLVIGRAPGLLRKVTAVRSSREGSVELETVQGTLEDVFEQWDARLSKELGAGDVSFTYLAPGVTVQSTSPSSTRADLYTARLKLTDVEIEPGLVASGEVEVKTSLDHGCRIEWGKIQYFRFIQRQTVTGEVALKALVKKSTSKRFQLAHAEGSPILISAWPPIWLTPAVDVNLRIEGSIEAGVKVSSSVSITTRVGAVYDKGHWNTVNECSSPQFSSPLNNFGPYLEMSVKASVPEVQLGAKIMSVAGPYVAIDLPFIQLTLKLEQLLDPIPHAKVDLVGGVGARVGVYVQVLGTTLTSQDWDIPLVAEVSFPTFPRDIPLGGTGLIVVRSAGQDPLDRRWDVPGR